MSGGKKKRGIRTGEENSNFLSCLETLSQSNIMSLWLYLPSLWNCCGFVDKLHVTLPADILINTGRNKKKSPVLSSLQGNGLMASMYDEMGEKKQDFFFVGAGIWMQEHQHMCLSLCCSWVLFVNEQKERDKEQQWSSKLKSEKTAN